MRGHHDRAENHPARSDFARSVLEDYEETKPNSPVNVFSKPQRIWLIEREATEKTSAPMS